jgi:Caspase domain
MPKSEPSTGGAYALLTATGRYSDPTLVQLRAPTRDAEELAKVLRNPAIGGFTVSTLVDKPGHLVRETIEGFFADRSLNDLLVFYASCHGVKDPSGRLYFAATTTKVSRLASTGISAEFLFEQVDRCRAQKILVLLDCCYSGSYAKGHLPRSGDQIGIGLHEGRGRAAISSSTTQEYSFEITTGKVTGTASPSVFTAALVKGLGTGAADIDGDGFVSVDDLYTYVRNEIRAVTPYQTPEKKWGDVRGDFVIARNPDPPVPRPEQPPIDVRRAVWSDPASSPAGNAVVETTPANTRFWSLTSYLAVPTGLGAFATLLILGIARGGAIRTNALLSLVGGIIYGSGPMALS